MKYINCLFAGKVNVHSWSRSKLLEGHLAWNACSSLDGLCSHLLQGGNALELGGSGADPGVASSLTDQLAALARSRQMSPARMLKADHSKVLWWLRAEALLVFWRSCRLSDPEVTKLLHTRGEFWNTESRSMSEV